MCFPVGTEKLAWSRSQVSCDGCGGCGRGNIVKGAPETSKDATFFISAHAKCYCFHFCTEARDSGGEYLHGPPKWTSWEAKSFSFRGVAEPESP